MASPYVRVNEVDQSQYTPLANALTNPIGIVGAAQFGPVNVAMPLTSVRQFETIFGTPIDIAGLTAVNVLKAGGNVLYGRFFTGTEADSKLKANLYTATENTLDLEANYAGTIVSGAASAKINIKNVVQGLKTFVLTVDIYNAAGDLISAIVPAVTLSWDPNSSNYFEKWDNAYFKMTMTGTVDFTQFTGVTDKNFTNWNSVTNGVNSTLKNNAASVISALNACFADPEANSLFYLSAPLYSTITESATNVQKTMIDIAETRKDCVVQLDHTPGLTAQGIVDAFPIATINSSRVAVWGSPQGYVIDTYSNNAKVSAPASAYVLPALAAEYSNSPVWTAPAGASRFLLTYLDSLDSQWTVADRDLLYDNGINPICNYKGLGYTSLGQKTMQYGTSALDRLNVRQLVNYIKQNIEQISVGYMFAPIDDTTFSNWSYDVANFLTQIKTQRGLYEYTVKMDWETVTPQDVENNRLPGIVQIKPTKVAEYIDIDLVIKNYSDTL